jgi:hypothetical protein
MRRFGFLSYCQACSFRVINSDHMRSDVRMHALDCDRHHLTGLAVRVDALDWSALGQFEPLPSKFGAHQRARVDRHEQNQTRI